MASSVGEIAVTVGADITSLRRGMSDGADAVESFNVKAGRSLTNAAASVAKYGAAAAAAAAVAVGALVKSSIDNADALSKMSKIVGISTEKLSALQYAAGLSGVENENLSASLIKLAKNSRDAYLGVGSAKDAFIALGISVKDSAGNLLSNDQIFAQVVDKFSKMPDGIGKTALAMDIFGKSGATLIPLLNEGSSGLSKLSEEAGRLGVIIGSEAAAQAEIFNDNLDKMKAALSGVGNKIATETLPALNEFTGIINSPETQQGLASLATGVVKIGVAAAGALAEFISFSKFIGEELARTVHGAADDDISGLTDRLIQLQAQTDPKNFADWMSNSNMGDMLTGKGKLLQEIEEVKKKIQAAYASAEGIPAPKKDAQQPTVTPVTEEDVATKAMLDAKLAEEKIKRDERLAVVNAKIEAERMTLAQKDLDFALGKEAKEIAIAERTQQRQQQELDYIKARYMTKEQAEIDHNDIMATIGEEFDASKFETEAQWRSVKEQAEAEHLARMTEMNRTAYDGIAGIIEQKWGKGAATTATAFKSILGTMATGSRKAFEISKAWAIGDALVSTYQGIAKGVALGYPAAIPAVAMAAATGFAQVSAIRSQKFGGGGGAAASGNGTAGVAPNPIGVGGNTGGGSSSSTLTVAPINPNSIFSGSAMVGFGQQIYDFTKDGGKVVFSA